MTDDASGPEFYARPVFAVANVAASVAYYCEKLGFDKHWKSRDSPDVPLIIGQVGRQGIDIILDGGTKMARPAQPSVLSLSLHPPSLLGALYREFEQLGAILTGPPVAAHWQKGIWEFHAKDLDGNVLSFSADESPDLVARYGR